MQALPTESEHTMTGLLGVKVGDTLIITHYRYGGSAIEEHIATKVGRKLVYIGEGRRQSGFYIATGRERADNARIAYTSDGWAEWQRRRAVLGALRARHDAATYRGAFNTASTAALEQILAILDNDAADRKASTT